MAVRAPEIDRPGIVWLNTATPLSLATLKGRLVILDFWTFCCINCIHVLPILRRIEEAYPDNVTVIGVHSPKFAAERLFENVAQAVQRYDIHHPVAHDPDLQLWRQFAVRAWPTLVFIDPRGYILGQFAGEPDPTKLLALTTRLLEEAKTSGMLDPAPLPLDKFHKVDNSTQSQNRLSFPGKIKPVPKTDGHISWAIADAGHHQIALLSAEGDEIKRYGSGKAGLHDGLADVACFSSPQGLIATDKAIYVADTGNHAIRRIDLNNGQVTTVCGIGRRGRILPFSPLPGKITALASPWDLEINDQILFIANAGTHQLLAFDLTTETIKAIAGSGAENIHDAPAAEAALAQPSGLTYDKQKRILYFADSETSSIRALHLQEEPRVETLIGQGLFQFGHVNGDFEMGRLQHPLGLALVDDKLFVADSYNGAIRTIDLNANNIQDFDDGKFLCRDHICLPLGEPAGIAMIGNRLFLSDTNNHRILCYNLNRKSYQTWFA